MTVKLDVKLLEILNLLNSEGCRTVSFTFNSAKKPVGVGFCLKKAEYYFPVNTQTRGNPEEVELAAWEDLFRLLDCYFGYAENRQAEIEQLLAFRKVRPVVRLWEFITGRKEGETVEEQPVVQPG